MFNLEEAIYKWRKQMLNTGIKSTEILDELESHLREEIEWQLRSGIDESLAFEVAARQIGQADQLKKEFARAGEKRWAFFPPRKNFAASAKETLDIAPGEARRFHHDYVGTEHVLLRLIQPSSGIVFNVMQKLGVSGEAVRMEIQKIMHPGPAHHQAAKIPFTPRAKRAIQLAADEARSMNQPNITAAHLFLGLLLEGHGVAALVLKNLGIRIENAREETLKQMRANPDIA